MRVDVHAHVYACPKIKSAGAGAPFIQAADQIAVMGPSWGGYSGHPTV